METIHLKTTPRDTNKRTAKALYREGLIPVELYGHNIENMHLSVNQIEFEKVLRKAGESTLIDLELPDGSSRNVLVQDVQSHYLTTRPIHVDLYEVKMNEKLTANVPIVFVGESPAVKAKGGTLVKVLNEVEVECLPKDLPHSIEVDISVIDDFEKTITVKDLNIGNGVEITADADEVIATVQPPRDMEAEEAGMVDEAAAVAAAVGPEAGAEAEADEAK